MPGYCSGATYLVFLKTLQAFQDNGTISLPRKTWNALVPRFARMARIRSPTVKASGDVGTRMGQERRDSSTNSGSGATSRISLPRGPVTF